MSIKTTASLVLLFFLLCTLLFPDVQGWWLSRRRRSGSSHRHKWQKGRTKSTNYNGWDTKFDDQFTWKCSGNGQSIWNIQSDHEYYHEDRVWSFSCQYDSKITSTCSWKSPGRVNSFDGTFNYKCPRNGHIVGMFGSTFNGHFKDREFNFRCCDGTVPRINCEWTSYRHGWDAKLNYEVPSGYYLAGASSYHNDRYEDRRWRFYICQSDDNWDTKFLESFSWICQGLRESIWKIRSVHENDRNDRVWGYNCRHNPYITTTCAWSLPNNQYLNDYNGNVNFTCPRNGYIEGMHANKFSNDYKDRRFDFRCCDGTRLRRNCKWTSYVNDWDVNMNYDVPSGYYLAGAYSYHINHYQDRRWKFYICR